MDFLHVDQKLVDAILEGTNAGFMMSGVAPAAVGVSKLAPHSQEIAVLVGLAGKRSGTVTLLMSRRAAVYLASRFLGCEHEESIKEMRDAQVELSLIREDIFDAISEIGNIIAGTVKEKLEEYGVTTISCPSIIFGADYNMYHFKGFDTASVEYEVTEIPQYFFMERYIGVAISLSHS